MSLPWPAYTREEWARLLDERKQQRRIQISKSKPSTLAGGEGSKVPLVPATSAGSRSARMTGLADGGALRVELFEGRPHLVVPVVALVGNSVVRPLGSHGPEFVPSEELEAAPSGWDGRPILPDHPNQGTTSANDPAILQRYKFGHMFNTRFEDDRLKTEAWLDPARAEEVGPDAVAIIEDVLDGHMVEVSVGVFVVAEEASGVAPNGDKYDWIWHDLTPDHLAMGLHGQQGACSVVAGCGAPRLMVDMDIRAGGGPGSGNFGHAGRPGEVGGSMPGGGSGGAEVRDTPASYTSDAEPTSSPDLAAQAATGIAAVEALSENAIANANYSGLAAAEAPAVVWDDLPADTKDAVLSDFYEHASESAWQSVDTSDIDADFRERLQNSAVNGEIYDEVKAAVIAKLAGEGFGRDLEPVLPGMENADLHRVLDPTTIVVSEDYDPDQHEGSTNDLSGQAWLDTSQLQWSDGTPLTESEQGIVEDKWQKEMDDILQSRFDDRSDDSQWQEAEQELVAQLEDEQWNALTDGQKVDMAADLGLDIGKAVVPAESLEPGPPSTWVTGTDPADDPSTENYIRSAAIASQLVHDRMYAIAEERGITPPTEHDVEEIWRRWKGSSSNFESQALQLATSRELGGVNRLTDREIYRLDNAKTGWIESLQCYVRAQWEVNQWLMQKAGEDTVDVYRAVLLPKADLDNTRTETIPRTNEEGAHYDDLHRLPDLPLKRNGLQSTTGMRGVANSWNGVDVPYASAQRVVLRIRAPRTSVMSLPVYGKNVHGEHETVLAGTKDHWWWDVWKGSAPDWDEFTPGWMRQTHGRRHYAHARAAGAKVVSINPNALDPMKPALTEIDLAIADQENRGDWLRKMTPGAWERARAEERGVIIPRPKPADMRARGRALGGPGSGNWGHAGRPGEVGGSAPGGGGQSVREVPPDYASDPLTFQAIPFPPTIARDPAKLEAHVQAEAAKLAAGIELKGGAANPTITVQLSRDAIASNVDSLFQAATPAELAEKDWYAQQTGALSTALYDKYKDAIPGLTKDQVAGVVAATSVNTVWSETHASSNQAIASRVMAAWAANITVTLDEDALTKAAAYARGEQSFKGIELPPPGSYTFRELAALDPRAALLLATNGEGHGFGGLVGNAIAPLKILQGVPPSQALSQTASKVRSYYANTIRAMIGDRTDQDVTLDIWMVRAMSGLHTLDRVYATSFLGSTSRYEYYRRILVEQAARAGMLPREYQAVVWSVLRNRYPVADVRRINGDLKKVGKTAKANARRSAVKRRRHATSLRAAQLDFLDTEDTGFEDPQVMDETAYILWWPRFLAHEEGIDFPEDEVFGPWDDDDEEAAALWRGPVDMRAAGGPGSGNFGHAGRPGEVGGSAPGGGHEPGPSEGDTVHEPWNDPGGWEHSGVTWKQPVDPDTGRPIPIKVSTVEEAVSLVLEGKVVEVKDVSTVHTVLTRLATLAIEAKAAGRDAPVYDLCQVSVAGSNLFCVESLPVPRIEMPQVSGEPVPGSEADKLSHDAEGNVDGSKAFVTYLQGLGIGTSTETVPAAHLRASQMQMIGPKVAGMMANKSYDPGKKPIFVSADNYIVDGHHRWAAVVGRDMEDGHLGDAAMHVVRINATIAEVLHLALKWSVRFGIKQKSGAQRHAAAILKGISADLEALGGAGSGNWGHAGRPGEVGGSAPGDGGGTTVREKVPAYGDLEASKASIEKDLARIIGGSPYTVNVEPTENTVNAARVVAKVLENMDSQGYMLPDGVLVENQGTSLGAVTTHFGGFGLTNLQVKIPTNLPPGADLDKACRRGLAGATAVESLRDVVVHELGHIQAGFRNHEGLEPRDEEIAGQVSRYARTNVDEFLAETFVRLVRGDVLPEDVLDLYRKYEGPQVPPE